MRTRTVPVYDSNPTQRKHSTASNENFSIGHISDVTIKKQLQNIINEAEMISVQDHVINRHEMFTLIARGISDIIHLDKTAARILCIFLEVFDIIGDLAEYKVNINYQYVVDKKIDSCSYRTFIKGIDTLLMKEVIFATNFRETFFLNKEYCIIPQRLTIISNYSINEHGTHKITYSNNKIQLNIMPNKHKRYSKKK